MGYLRKAALKILKVTAFDIKIKHHYTKKSFLLNTYNHKGYWYYGARREQNTIKLFQSWIKPNQYVLEIGAHIGYFSTLYASLVGGKGKVDVFEPSEKNAKYLKENIRLLPEDLQKITTVVNKGAGDVDEVLDFYIDPISGQNNSFVKNFDGFFSNREQSAESNAELIKEQVEVIRLDTYFKNKTHFPDFVKVDVEGFEWKVVQGFADSIEKSHPGLMIEIQADAEKIIDFFKEKGYIIFNDKMQVIDSYETYLSISTPNIFFRYQHNNE